MISKITMNQVASYKSTATLETDKKVNLIYGLNGTGKSTLSDYLYDRTNPIFSQCSLEGLSDEKILVYNRKFINDYFYEPEWVTEIRDQCVEAGIPFFFKQWGGVRKKKNGKILDGRIWNEFPSRLAVA